MSQVGFIGLGSMGLPMAQRIHAGGQGRPPYVVRPPAPQDQWHVGQGRLLGSQRLGSRSLHGLLQLFKRPHFNLADAFAAHAEFLRKVFQRLGLVDQAAFGQDVLFAFVERAHRLGQQGVAVAGFLCVGDHFVLQRAVVLQHVLPLAFAIFVERDVEAGIAAHHHAAVHVDHLMLGNAQLGGDGLHVIGMQIASTVTGIVQFFWDSGDEERHLLVNIEPDDHHKPDAYELVDDIRDAVIDSIDEGSQIEIDYVVEHHEVVDPDGYRLEAYCSAKS